MRALCFLACALLPCVALLEESQGMAPLKHDRPNILWLTCEDTGRHLGCYDFTTAQTPELDRLAARGTRYTHAWSNYPVCAPARTTIITGCYAASLGAEQMRSFVPLPASIKLFPSYLREAGYYCTNNAKEDYNALPSRRNSDWHQSNRKAHWKYSPSGAPFFAVFNFGITHESRIRDRHELQRNPETTPIPRYHPNVIEIRRDWSQYYDRVTEMDAMCGERLRELQGAGLAENTIVFFFGDHGSGMPRNKRTPLDCGLGVPLILYIPPKFASLAPADYKENCVSERLISFVDLAPTVLSLAGIKPPATMQGVPFAGAFIDKPRELLYGFRGRMDERSDLVRSVTDGRYVYVRNFHPEIIYGARNDYMFQTRTTQVWRQLYDNGGLPPEQRFFWELKPTEELYDLWNDPDEVVNLIDSVEHVAIAQRLRASLREELLRIRDVHFMPENMLHRQREGVTPYDFGHNTTLYPFEKILDAAYRATDRTTNNAVLKNLIQDTEPAVRYWGMIGVLTRLTDTAGTDGTKPGDATIELLREWQEVIACRINDPDCSVRIVAAEISGRFGSESDVLAAWKTLSPLIDDEQTYVSHQALEGLDAIAPRMDSDMANEVSRQLEMFNRSHFQERIGSIPDKIIGSIKKRLKIAH